MSVRCQTSEDGGTESKIQKLQTSKEEDALQMIANWLNLEENLYLNAKMDRSSLLCFIRGCKFNIEKTKNKMVRFYEMKTRVPEWYQNRDPNLQQISEVLGLGVFIPLLGKDSLNRTVIILRTGVHNPRIHKQSDVFKVSKMILDLLLRDDETVAGNGITAIFDMKNIGLAHVIQMTPSVIRNSVDSIQNYPPRTKNLIFANSPFHINLVLNIFRSFMTEKLKNRITVYGNNGFSKVVREKHVPSNILPNCYGGTGGELEDLIVYWKKKTVENRDWFLDDEKYRASLSK